MYICTPMFRFLRSILFLMPAETAHKVTMTGLMIIRRVGAMSLIKKMLGVEMKDSPSMIMGLEFRNRMGLAAGFDKNAEYMDVFDSLGFGFVEIGTVTPLPQSGNAKPRLFRLPKDHGLINRMGFNNDGVELVCNRLKRFREKYPQSQLIIGGNIGKNKSTPNEVASDDYRKCFEHLYHLVDYFVVNVSSPNTPNLRELQDKEPLRKIFASLVEAGKVILAEEPSQALRPILVKISPDNSKKTIDDILDLTREFDLAGVVCSNTTVDRKNLNTTEATISRIGLGGLSGRPLKHKSNELISYLRKKDSQMTIIGVGGVESAEDVMRKALAGSDLIQVYTGFIYAGPRLVSDGTKVLASTTSTL